MKKIKISLDLPCLDVPNVINKASQTQYISQVVEHISVHFYCAVYSVLQE